VIFKKICPGCQGLRLREPVLQIRIGRVTLAEMLSSPLTGLKKLLENNDAAFSPGHASPKEQLVCQEIMPILFRQLHSLVNLGIGYLTLSRAVNTLSGGEHQRLRLASLLSNRLNYTLFVLDEISRGLHPLDVSNLLEILRTLLQGGNTIVAIDHHPLVTAQADWIIQLGPDNGKHGGRVLSMGSEKPQSAIDLKIPAPAASPLGPRPIVISSARVHNLKHLNLTIPAKGLTVLCGVSGSGKSTLLHRVIYESAIAGHPVNCSGLSGLDQFKQVYQFMPMNPARYGSKRLHDFLNVSGTIYDAFVRAAGKTVNRSQLKKALTARSSASSCSHCDGKGEWSTDLDYLGSFVEPCTYCRGSGLSAELCQLELQGKPLADVLADDIDALPAEVIAGCQLGKVVSCLQEFALGYLNLGRRLLSLSGGELQRLRLARLFLNLQNAPRLLLLDEPDSGLSFDECRQLIKSMKKHLTRGHAAIVISHHPLMMCQADYLVDLGPGAGEEGGKLTACGTAHELLAGNWPLSRTATYLQQLSDLES
jgi:excinuclease ABC subunit A